uniref:G_PROTEIN_RECEP_F1_2 domain-containing protein n=1 Tax=Haemonchus contortus TaxID=6289 RepID=A0A7I4YSJ2_HAECO
MYPNSKPVPYHVLYIVIPVISFIGNGLIIYVTIRSRALRSPCSILIALVSLSDMMLVSSNLISTSYHNIVQKETIPQPICAYLQLIPLFGACTSPMFLLAIAIDRLLSMMTFYKPMVASYSRRYIVAQVLPGCIMGTVLDVLVLANRKYDQMVVCILVTPMQGTINDVHSRVIIAICLLIILCNASFIFFLKKLRMNSSKSKSIYRSMVVISLSVVLGYFSTMAIFSMKKILDLSIEMIYLNMIAGLFTTAATSVNFFVYYCISKEYRSIFDKLLGIGHIKTWLSENIHSDIQQTTNQPKQSSFRSTLTPVT